MTGLVGKQRRKWTTRWERANKELAPLPVHDIHRPDLATRHETPNVAVGVDPVAVKANQRAGDVSNLIAVEPGREGTGFVGLLCLALQHT